ncbi:MAG: putative thioesterase [Acidobacteria bacterium]|nr:MAG: putative thioesterase [Acidobacteriota bacterium]
MTAKPRLPTPWLANVQRRQTPSLRLFCLPYAGGSTVVFHKWHKYVSSDVEIYPVQLPGHGMRLREVAFTSMDALVESTLNGLLPFFFDCPFALFGHSMGALLAFELGRLLRARHNLEPEKLIVSGRRAPQLADNESPVYKLPENEFILQLHRLNGTPHEILSNREMLELVLPILRADFEVVQTYTYRAGEKLSCPIKAFGGLREETVSESDLMLWADHTIGAFSLSMIRGDHFFIHQSQQEFMAVVANDLSETVAMLRKRRSQKGNGVVGY